MLTWIVWLLVAIRLYGKNWKKVTQHVGTRISAQVRSHAQKVLKDYSPNSGALDSRDDVTEQADETLKEQTIRTYDLNCAANRLEIKAASNRDADDDYLAKNLN